MPEELDKLYNEPLQEVFQTHLRNRDGGKAELFKSLEDNFVELLATVSQGESIEETNNRLEEGFEEYTDQSIRTIKSSQEKAREKVEQAHEAGYLAASGAVSASVPDWSPNSDVDPYSRAPFKGNISSFVRASVEEEVSYFKQDLKFIRKYVSEDRYAKAVSNVLASGNEDVKRRLLDRGIDLDDFDLDDLQDRAAQIFQNTKTIGSSDIRGVLKELEPEEIARRNPQLFERIKRNGTDNLSRVMDEVAKDLAVDSPAIRAVSWTLSIRHGGLYSSPDACDVLASQNAQGLGPGLYKPESVPSHPHPNCECRITARTMDAENWGSDPIDTPSAPNIDEGSVRAVMQDVSERMDSGGRTVTDNHVETQTELINQVMREVIDNPRG